MNIIVFFPVSCLKKLDRLGINYTTDRSIDTILLGAHDPHSSFCTIAVSNEDYDRAYEIGCNEHKRMLMKAYGKSLDDDIHKE